MRISRYLILVLPLLATRCVYGQDCFSFDNASCTVYLDINSADLTEQRVDSIYSILQKAILCDEIGIKDLEKNEMIELAQLDKYLFDIDTTYYIDWAHTKNQAERIDTNNYLLSDLIQLKIYQSYKFKPDIGLVAKTDSLDPIIVIRGPDFKPRGRKPLFRIVMSNH